jgi:hypothetical protein
MKQDASGNLFADAQTLFFNTSTGAYQVPLAGIGSLARSTVDQVKSEINNNLTKIDTGEEFHGTDELGWNLFSGSGIRWSTYHITFKKQFSTPPTVSLATKMINTNDPTNFNIVATNITTTGFDLSFGTWNIWKMAALGASWIAVGK